MKRLLSLAMLATMFGALFLPLQSASAGYNGPWIPDECDYDVVWEALNNGAELIYADEWDDRTHGGSGNQVIIGTWGDDDLRGGTGNDVLCGVDDEDGDDLYGGGGSDILISGDDDTDMYGGTGNDLFLGYEADDCKGGSGYDTAAVYCYDGYPGIENFW